MGTTVSGSTAAFKALALPLCRELPVRQAAALLRAAAITLATSPSGTTWMPSGCCSPPRAVTIRLAIQAMDDQRDALAA
jgi:hypothetical protein